MTDRMTITLLCGSLLLAAMTPTTAGAETRSGYDFIKPASRTMQDDEFENPGFISVERGQQLFNNKPEGTGKSCAACHQADGTGLNPRSLARYPVYDADAGITTLQARISRCRDASTGNKPLPVDHPDLVSLETFVRNLAHGVPVNVTTDGPVAELLVKGEKLYKTRYGLIDMACHQCHDVYPGHMIRGQKISQGQGNGFPAYRLDTGEITTLSLRIQQCLSLMRAEPFAADSEESKLLELYIMSRSNGLGIETPAIRY